MNKAATPKDVLFIINKSKTIALFNQARSINQQAVIWDYHVILTAQVDIDTVVFDFDSLCDFPVDIRTYFTKTFPASNILPETVKPQIKAINAEYYLQHFFSNRLHMQGLIESHQYPAYDVIKPSVTSNILSLENCWDVTHLSKESILCETENYIFD